MNMKTVNSGEKAVKEPLFHIVKRAAMPFWKTAAIRVLAVLSAVIVCSIMSTVLIGRNPFTIFSSFVKGIFIDPWTLLQDTAMLLAFGIAIVPAFKMKYWNMGANGQVLMGCLAAIYWMLHAPESLPDGVVILLMLVSAVLCGIIWAAIPAIFKALFNTNETLFTLMMNYIAIGIVNHFCYKETKYQKINIGIVNLLDKRAWLPQLGNKYVLPILVVALMTAFVFVYMKYSKHGYEIAVVGESSNTARYVGINVKKVIIRTLIVSGAICGVIGFLYAGAISHTVSEMTATLGFTAILVAWLGKFNPLIMIGTALFVVIMKTGTGQINTDFALGGAAFSDMVTGIVFFFIIGCEFFITYSLKPAAGWKAFAAKCRKKFGKKTVNDAAREVPASETEEKGGAAQEKQDGKEEGSK